jgi:hypothetical protein
MLNSQKEKFRMRYVLSLDEIVKTRKFPLSLDGRGPG